MDIGIRLSADPGSLELAHQIDEYVEEEQIRKAVDFYENFLVLA